MPRNPQDRIKVNVYVQTNVLAALKKIALMKGTSYSELLRQAAAEYVVREGSRALQEKKQIEAAGRPSDEVEIAYSDSSGHSDR